MIQLIDKDAYGWHLIIHQQPCYFSRTLQLYTTGLQPLLPNADNGLRWRINSKWVSYRQIKAAIRTACTNFNHATPSCTTV